MIENILYISLIPISLFLVIYINNRFTIAGLSSDNFLEFLINLIFPPKNKESLNSHFNYKSFIFSMVLVIPIILIFFIAKR